MQMLVTVIAKPGPSLRDAIVNDPKLKDYELELVAKKDPERSRGWAKLHCSDAHGAVNVEWLSHSSLLLCRIVTRGPKSRPSRIIGYLTEYLLSRHRRRIVYLQVARA